MPTPALFELGEGDQAALAYDLAAGQKKSTFALELAIEKTEWNVPRYIADGLRWLAHDNPDPAAPPETIAVEIVAEAVSVGIDIDEVDDHA
ncbi:hypothetical protein [Alcaligenes sp.]|uniref:hypothetical protein n=1 Tax=Alcaligenes sp. TaxID=512 RepID=UPI003D034FAE